MALIDAVTHDDLMRVGALYLRPELAALAVVGPYPQRSVFEGLI